MEILIIGGIVVALMVYVSTRIKKESQRAYEREIYETEEFTISKPDDFIIPVSEDSPYEFEARSRDFGIEDEVREFYQCQATISVREGIESPESFERPTAEKGITLNTFYKIVSKPALNKTYELEISVLPDFKDKYQDKINEMLNSFAVK